MQGLVENTGSGGKHRGNIFFLKNERSKFCYFKIAMKTNSDSRRETRFSIKKAN